MKVISTNRKAYHDYFVENTYEAGICLEGSEVKSIRQGNCNLKDTFILIDKNNEIAIKNMYIKPYEKSTAFVPDERRDHKLLMHKAEIEKLLNKKVYLDLRVKVVDNWRDKENFLNQLGYEDFNS